MLLPLRMAASSFCQIWVRQCYWHEKMITRLLENCDFLQLLPSVCEKWLEDIALRICCAIKKVTYFCEKYIRETEKGEMGADTDSLAPDTKEMLTTVFRCNKRLILMRYSSWCNPGLAFTLTFVSTPQEVRCSWQRFSLWCRAGQPHEIRW